MGTPAGVVPEDSASSLAPSFVTQITCGVGPEVYHAGGTLRIRTRHFCGRGGANKEARKCLKLLSVCGFGDLILLATEGRSIIGPEF